MATKRVLFFQSPVQRGLSDTYPHLSCTISTTFETADVNRDAGVYTREKFPNLCVGILQLPSEAVGLFWVGCLLSAYTAQTAQFPAIEIISGASRHSNDVPFEVE